MQHVCRHTVRYTTALKASQPALAVCDHHDDGLFSSHQPQQAHLFTDSRCCFEDMRMLGVQLANANVLSSWYSPAWKMTDTPKYGQRWQTG